MIIMIILLILCLPIILMISLFTTTTVVSIAVDVPVMGIDVMIEEIVEIDLDKGETFLVDYHISPKEASNKKVNFIFTPLGDYKLAEFRVEGDRLIPITAGYAHVIVETVDGGYRDSFDIIVRTRSVEEITSTPQQSEITVGEITGINTVFSPRFVNNEGLTYRVKEGEDIVTVTKGGKIQGIGIGTAVIEVTSQDNPNAKSEFEITVNSSGVIDFISDQSYITALETSSTVKTVINPEVTLTGYDIKLFDAEGAPLPDSVIDVAYDISTGILSYTFIDQSFLGAIDVQLTVTPDGAEPVTKNCTVTRISEISIAWEDQGGDGEYAVLYSQSEGNRIGIDLKPIGANVSYDIMLEYGYKTDVKGDIQSGERFKLEENVVYTCDKGYASIELESTSAGVFLVVRGTASPSLDDINSDYTVTNIYLSVTDENTGKVTVLGKISVVVY